jgi:hypothetical protein
LQTVTVTDSAGNFLPGSFSLTVTGVAALPIPTLSVLTKSLLLAALGIAGIFLSQLGHE